MYTKQIPLAQGGENKRRYPLLWHPSSCQQSSMCANAAHVAVCHVHALLLIVWFLLALLSTATACPNTYHLLISRGSFFIQLSSVVVVCLNLRSGLSCGYSGNLWGQCWHGGRGPGRRAGTRWGQCWPNSSTGHWHRRIVNARKEGGRAVQWTQCSGDADIVDMLHNSIGRLLVADAAQTGRQADTRQQVGRRGSTDLCRYNLTQYTVLSYTDARLYKKQNT